MMTFLADAGTILLATMRDVLPILVLIILFQLFVLRQPIPHLRRLITGGVYVVLGLALFLIGLEKTHVDDGNELDPPPGASRDMSALGL